MTPDELKGLRTAVEYRFGGVISVPSDFDKLSRILKNELSSSTLKRAWGYNKDHKSISPKTANILAGYLGFGSYEEFLKVGMLVKEEHQMLHNASQIAMLAGRVHSERGDRAFELLTQCKYREALAMLTDIDNEVEVLKSSSEGFIESAFSIIAEVNLKAMAIWSCDYDKEGCIERIDELFEGIRPLALIVNDHFLLWFIYIYWASWSLQSGDAEKAMALQDLSIIQGRILQLENPDEPPIQLLFSLNDKAMMLADAEMYEESEVLIAEALTMEGDKLIEGFLWLNHTRNCYELGGWQDNIAHYEKILALLREWNSENDAINESIYLEAATYYNLAIFYQNFQETNDSTTKAIEYYELAIEMFECRKIPNIAYQQYHQYAIEQLNLLRRGLPS